MFLTSNVRANVYNLFHGVKKVGGFIAYSEYTAQRTIQHQNSVFDPKANSTICAVATILPGGVLLIDFPHPFRINNWRTSWVRAYKMDSDAVDSISVPRIDAATHWLISKESLTDNFIPYPYGVMRSLKRRATEVTGYPQVKSRSQATTATQTLGGMLVLANAKTPGCHEKIALASVLPLRTIRKHLLVLETAGAITRRPGQAKPRDKCVAGEWKLTPHASKEGKSIACLPRWFAMASGKWTERIIFADMVSRIAAVENIELTSATDESVRTCLAESAAVGIPDLIERTQLSRPAVSSALKRLIRMGAACKSTRKRNRVILNPLITVTAFVAKANKVSASLGLKRNAGCPVIPQ